MPDFEVFKKRFAPLVKQPYVTIQTRGTISLNKAAFLAIGSPEAVELLWDAKDQIIGFRPVDRDVEHAYPVRNATKPDANAFVLSGTAFAHHYGIVIAVSTRYSATTVEGVLCVDLKTGGTEVTSNRAKKDATS